MELGFCWIRHPCLARSARLKVLRSLNPMPPTDLGLHIFSQETHANFLSLYFCPHQKLFTIEFNSLHRESGRLKQPIVYVGVAWATTLIRISQPALDSNLPFQFAIFLPTWSFIRLKAFFFPCPTNGSKPKYFSCC